MTIERRNKNASSRAGVGEDLQQLLLIEWHGPSLGVSLLLYSA